MDEGVKEGRGREMVMGNERVVVKGSRTRGRIIMVCSGRSKGKEEGDGKGRRRK